MSSKLKKAHKEQNQTKDQKYDTKKDWWIF